MAKKTSLKKINNNLKNNNLKTSTDLNLPSFLNPENRPVQYFSQEYIDQCKKMTLEEIVKKIDEQQKFFWQMHDQKNNSASILISLKVPKNLLLKFKNISKEKNLKYQTQIKTLMQEWLVKQIK